MNNDHRGAHERPDLFEDDLTDERGPSPMERDEVAHTQVLDPDTDDEEAENPPGLDRPSA